jgi:hypothetical protein
MENSKIDFPFALRPPIPFVLSLSKERTARRSVDVHISTAFSPESKD